MIDRTGARLPPSHRVRALVRVLLCGSLGVAVGVTLAWVVPWQVASLLGWDTFAIAFCVWVAVAVHGADAIATERHATREDDSRTAADLLLTGASVASLFGVGFALLEASSQTGRARTGITTVAVITVALSWLSVHTLFTLRYAHLYYLERSGIDFHTDEAPDYRDFAYVAFTLGMTYQVSDTNLTSRRIRRVALRHALLSYVFGIAVIAMTINVVAGLLGR